jgi:hypothetical protein
MPILQVAIQQGLTPPGNQIVDPGDYSLIILHPRRVVISAIISTNSFSSYKEIICHDFTRNAFNFCIGQFSNKLQLIVQSVDGALFFFHQGKMLF